MVLRAIHEVKKHLAPLSVTEEAVPKPDALSRTLNQTWNVSQYEP
jgi:hypothetical protein